MPWNGVTNFCCNLPGANLARLYTTRASVRKRTFVFEKRAPSDPSTVARESARRWKVGRARIFQLRCADCQLDSHYASCHSSAHDYHPHPLDRLACWGCRPEPMGAAVTSRDRSLYRIRHRGGGPWSWRYSNPLPRDCVHARHDRGPRLAVTECLTDVVRTGTSPRASRFCAP